jgi:5'-nucleotidase
VSDIHLAQESESIDLILGGHTHTFMDAPDIRRNKAGDPVIIHQVGWAGMRLGKIDVTFEHNKRNKCISCDGIWVKN